MDGKDKSFENLQKSVDDIVKEKNYFEQRREDIERENIEEKADLLLARKNEYVGVKYNFLNNLARRHFLQSLENGLSTSPEQATDAFKKSSKEVSKLKGDLQIAKELREDKVANVEKVYQRYVELKAKVAVEFDQLKLKKSELENKRSLYQAHLKKLEDENTTEITEEDISHMEKKILSLKNELQAPSEVKERIKILTEKENELKKLRHVQHDSTNAKASSLLQSEEYEKLICELAGISLVTASPTCIVVKFIPQQNANSLPASAVEALLMTISFCKDKIVGDKIESVSINIPSLDIEDIVETAVSRNDLQYLVNSVQERWHHHLPLVTEVEILRQSFALDWNESDRTVTVLYGKAASIVCKLQIETGYPDHGSVRLLSASPLPHGTDTSSLTPADRTSSLSHWLHHLQHRLVDTNAEHKMDVT